MLKTRGGRLPLAPLPSQVTPTPVPTNIPTLAPVRMAVPTLKFNPQPDPTAQVEAVSQQAEAAASLVSRVVSFSWSTLAYVTRRAVTVISPLTEEYADNHPTAKAMIKRAEDVKSGVLEVNNQLHNLQDNVAKVQERAKTTVESKTWWRQQWNANKSQLAARAWYGKLIVNAGDRTESVLARRWAEEEVETVLPRRMVDLNLIKSENLQNCQLCLSP